MDDLDFSTTGQKLELAIDIYIYILVDIALYPIAYMWMGLMIVFFVVEVSEKVI